MEGGAAPLAVLHPQASVPQIHEPACDPQSEADRSRQLPVAEGLEDLLPALGRHARTGVVDGQENPLPTIASAKLFEVQKFLILTGHIIISIGLAWIFGKKKEPVDTAPAASASTSEATPATLVPIDFVPTPEQQAKARDLVGQVDQTRWVFPPTALKDQSGPDLFVYLAASSETPAVIAASLRAMARLEAAKTAEAKATKSENPSGNCWA